MLYLITHDRYGAYKIGVMGHRAGRLDVHQKHGWKIYKKLEFTHFVDAYRVEQSTLRILWKKCGAKPYLSASQMPRGGWTETIDTRLIDLPRLWRLIKNEERRLTVD